MSTIRPWENLSPQMWQLGQTLYERVIAIHRPIIPTTVGEQPYQGMLPSREVVIFSGLPASIQYQLRRDISPAHLPADAFSMPLWHFWIPPGYVIDGDIVERDVVVDDLARRFQLFGVWPNQNGIMMAGELLEA